MGRRLALFLCGLLSVLPLPAPAETSIPLQRTAAAPPEASGVATFENANGGAALVIIIRQLGPASYLLSAVRKSDQRAISLGTIVVTDPTAGPDVDTNNNRKERHNANQSEVLETRTTITLPSGLAAPDVAEIKVSTPSQVVLLSGKPPRVSHPAQRKNGG